MTKSLLITAALLAFTGVSQAKLVKIKDNVWINSELITGVEGLPIPKDTNKDTKTKAGNLCEVHYKASLKFEPSINNALKLSFSESDLNGSGNKERIEKAKNEIKEELLRGSLFTGYAPIKTREIKTDDTALMSFVTLVNQSCDDFVKSVN